SERFISVATRCIHSASRGPGSTQTAAGLPANGRSVKASTWYTGTGTGFPPNSRSRGQVFQGHAPRGFGSGAGGDYRRNSVQGPQGKRCLRYDRMPGRNRETEALGNRRQDEHRFHHGERVTDAQARTAAEWEVGILRHALGAIVEPALRLELLRLGPPARI